MSRITYSLTKEYYRKKIGAADLINLVDYLNKNEITEEKLEDEGTVRDIIRLGMKKEPKKGYSKSDINVFRKTILSFKIDYLKTTPLYRINRGILVVACIELLLWPGQTDEEYRNIYAYHKSGIMYKELCKLCNVEEIDPVADESAKLFFGSYTLANINGIVLQTIRAYLKKIDINPEEMRYIINESFRIINSTIFDEQRFKADVLINLVNYLVIRDVKLEDLKKQDITMDMLYIIVGENRAPSQTQFREFEKFLALKLDYLKVTNLYQINPDILTVACVEHLLYPGQDREVYRSIYDCDTETATKVYNELHGFPEGQNVDGATVISATNFLRRETFLNEDGCLKTIRSYLKNIKFGPEEIEFIKNKSIELITDNEASDAVQPPTNVTNRPISAPTDDEAQARPPTPEVLPMDVDQPSTVSTPANQGFPSRYSPNDVVLAIRPRLNFFWPARIQEVHSDRREYVVYFLLGGLNAEVISEEDVKAFTEEEIDAAAYCLGPGLVQSYFRYAVSMGKQGD
ncbi:uncharacterized protein LOC106653558 [Trichogramma pretiosum]|uniref:uncharacterized protein LOC106653558 n=1 Tax=Trichogramma pretiosum TaxID=7493 RepID=UPI0006C97B6D|nr:uncharacterized protein LOC106653558 [Trichogramma pretiosum]